MTEKPQEAQISLWKAVEGLEGQLADLEAENAALRAAQDGKGQGMAECTSLQYDNGAIEQAEYIVLMARRLSSRVYDAKMNNDNGRAAYRTRESLDTMIKQMRAELLELRELL